jgi:hypothetical protein
VGIVTITVIVTSLFIINHSSTIKEVSILKRRIQSKIQIQVYRDEINKLYDIFQRFKPEITYLYSLTPGSNIDSLWAKGGVANPEPSPEEADSASPPTEVLNIQEIEMELKTTKELLVTIKNFLKYRKKIIENTPSIWPSKGYIISRYAREIRLHLQARVPCRNRHRVLPRNGDSGHGAGKG